MKTDQQHLECIVQGPPIGSKEHTATLIFFHGLGDRNDNAIEWLRYLLGRNLLEHHPHIRVIFPLAPRQPFSNFNGRMANVWFDIHGRNAANIDIPECRRSFPTIDRLVCHLIDAEAAAGIPLNRIAVGGFSMGGMMSLHVAYRLRPGIAGVFALSTLLSYDNQVFDWLGQREHSKSIPSAKLLWMHGDRDELLLHDWGRISFEQLQRFGVRGEFRTIAGMKHEMRAGELHHVEDWLAELLPCIKEVERNRVGCKL